MEIANILPTQQPSIKPQQQKANEAIDVAGRQAPTGLAIGADKTPAVSSGDTVSLSADSQQLAKSVNQQNSVNPTPITNNEHARNAVAQLVSDIRNYPNIALNAFGNVTEANLKPLQG